MRNKKARWISMIMVVSMCISLWNPGDYTLVSAKNLESNGITVQGANASTESDTSTETNDSGNSGTESNTEESGSTESNSGSSSSTGEETTATYKIVFVNDKEEEISETSSTLSAGQTLQLFPRLKEKGTDGKYVSGTQFEYSSSDKTVATVSDEGVVTAQSLSKEGTAKITVTCKNPDNKDETIKETYTITVTKVDVESVTLGLEKKTLIINDTYTLNPTVTPAAASQEVTYSSSDSTVANVSADGVITAIKVGDAKITVTSNADKTKSATISVAVIDVPRSIEFEQTECSVRETESVQLKAKLVYASGKKVDVNNQDLKFFSQDENIVTVDANGLVTAKDLTSLPQTVTVKATSSISYEIDGGVKTEEISGECQITVVGIPVSEVYLENQENSITMEIGDKYTLKPVVLPENASVKDLKFTSLDKDVAKVGSKGVITATGIGETAIVVSSKENPDIKVEFKVKVYQTVFDVTKLGADGTDSNADRKVINQALKYATMVDEPIQVIIPAGTYFLDGALTIYSDTTLTLADGAVIKRWKSAAGSSMLCNSIDSSIGGYGQCKNITITGGVWDGNTDGSKDANCIYIGHAENVTIRDTVVRNNSGAHLIELAGVNNGLIENVELYGYTICTESGYTAPQAEKEAIQLDYCGSISTPAMVPHDNTPCQNITVRNCNIHDYMSGIGTHTSVAGVYASNIVIENNQFTNITNACIDLRNFKDVTISGNRASGFTTFLYANQSTGTVTNNSAKNKSFTKMTNMNLLSLNVITVSNSSVFEITNNALNKATSNGICVWNGSTAVIKNNKIKNNNLYGIRTSASTVTLEKNTVTGNKKGCYDTYKNATVKSSDDIRAYYVSLKSSYKYTGKAIKPKITIKGLKKKNYKVTYKNNKKVGKATVIITGKGKVKKTLKLTFKIKK